MFTAARDPDYCALAPTWDKPTAILPSKVNLKAFEIRLRTIFSHMLRSTKTGSGSLDQSSSSRSPALSVAERNTLAGSTVEPASSVG